jgi:2-polyprenyl-6-methoxyphenol hydroxylase-like FAD-dependent oxidoreductase
VQPRRHLLVNEPLKVAIAGGSLGGLMAGLELAAAGADVRIYERSERVPDDRGAGIVMQPETLHVLTSRGGLREEETGVWLNHRQYLATDGSLESRQRMPQLMTSWGLLYRALRAAFPAERYQEAVALEGFKDGPSDVIAHFSDNEEKRVDLLVAADGSRSSTRQRLLPQIVPRYAGYVAWRGVVLEAEADTSLLRTFDDHFTFQQMRHSHILCYLIPGANGETERGQRRLNWVWYWNVPEPDLAAVITDRTGKLRDFSLPPGEVRADVLRAQDAVAHELFSPQFRELWAATREPFIQPILDLAVPQMVFGRTVLVGDAAFIPRPHTAASTSKAATNAITLGRAITQYPADIDAALGEWEPTQLALGRQLQAHGQTLGNRSQFGG